MKTLSKHIETVIHELRLAQVPMSDALGKALDGLQDENNNWKEDADRYAFAKTLEGQVVTLRVFRLMGADKLDEEIDMARTEL